MWKEKSRSEKADLLFFVYFLMIWGIEWFVYDMSHFRAVTRPIWDFVLR